MKIMNIEDPNAFFDVVRKCKGKVMLVTEDGDQLNLKSKFCQYIALTQMFTEAKIGELDLLVSEPDDAALLFDFCVRGN